MIKELNISTIPKILLIDDNEIDLKLLVNIFEEYYEIYIAKNATQAFKILKEIIPDLILLDLIIPEIDGFEILKQIRNNERTKNIPVIIVTAKTDSEAQVKSFKYGATDYIMKPFNMQVIQLRVKNLINLKRRTDLLEKMALIDGLTEIPNRRRFNEQIVTEWNRHLRYKEPLSLIMVDIDDFKEYNDNYGHLAGDYCLKKIANILKNSLKRSADFIARYGGEEFIIILPNTDNNGALAIAKNMKTNINNSRIEHKFSDVVPYVTLSFGISTTIPDMKKDYITFINLSDKMLYKSKSEGKNKINHIIYE